MTGGSLGLRPWSNGLLQKQPQNGASQASKLQKQQPLFLRKLPKTLVSSSREKQRWRICRYFGRKKLVMYIVVILALLVFIFGSFTASKESPGSIISHQNAKLDEWMKPSNSTRSGFTRVDNNKIDKTFNWKVNRKDENKYAQLSPRHSSKSGGEPCKNFALPPPPPRGGRQLGPRACPVCYIPIEQAIARMPHLPSSSPVVQNLNYFYEENPLKFEPHSGSGFGGFPSLKQRNESFDIKDSMTVHCGFVKGSKPGHQSGFDIEEADLMELEKFHDVIVASAIFGNYDIIQQPRNIGKASMENVPFYMFVDEETESYLKNSSLLDSNKRVGLWRIIVVQNIPYTDPRRNGKVPKLLLHRLFPNVRYSIWIDGKLKLVVDPYQILERFLWRQNATFAISRHYKRFDVFEEAEANKAAGKYYNSSIDEQINFYVREGLTPYSVAKLPITSDVPEGCVIIREHVPITNLFTCLWFNEVDRFTSRDQLSFSTVRDKIMDRTNWSISMFLDCERRNFVVQAYHKDLLDHMPPPTAIIRSPPSSLLLDRSPASRTSVKKIPVKRGKKDRRSRTKRRRRRVPTATSSRDGNFFWV